MDFLWKYYGVDWAAMVLTLFSSYQLSNKKRAGFLIGIFGSVAWLIFAWLTQSAASALANFAYVVLNVRGFMKWKNGPCP